MIKFDYIKERKLFSPREVAYILSLSPKTVYNWISLGKIRGKKFGNSKHGRIRIPREELERIFNEQPDRRKEDANKKEKEWQLRREALQETSGAGQILEEDESMYAWRG